MNNVTPYDVVAARHAYCYDYKFISHFTALAKRLWWRLYRDEL